MIARANRWPIGKLVAIYSISVPLALTLTPPGFSWHTIAAGCAVGLTSITGLAPWWLFINAMFLPALSWAVAVNISPLWPFTALLLLLLVYGRIWESRVPLFFSSARSLEALTDLLPAGPISFLDVGCGDGRVIRGLAAARPASRFMGIEQALAPWLLARLRCMANRYACSVVRGDFWKHDFSSYDVVYAYLSPAVMPELWVKAQREMRPGTRLISVFDIPRIQAHDCVEVGDAMDTQLHVWRMGECSEQGAI
ncbi:MAG: class I SAM-dependent methyltransferase [Pseudomonadota bacterium]